MNGAPARTGTRRPLGRAADVIASAATAAGLGSLPVRLRAWDGSEAGPADSPVLVLRSPSALRRILWRPGELGLAQAYVTGEIDVEGDLADGLRRVWQAAAPAARNGPAGVDLAGGARATAARPAAGWAAVRAAARLGALGPPLPAPASQVRVRGRLHSRSRDRAVVAGHYDLPAEFFELILDPAMAYSCGYWTSADGGYTLADAQRDKLELVCRKLALSPGSRLLDLGCGWGSLALHAALEHQVHVTAVTLSSRQGAYISRRVRELRLGRFVDVRVQDYRDAAGGPYDAVASIEMGEHVGAAGYPGFCAEVYRLVRPGGRVLIQQMSRGSRAPGGGPFIESFITADMHMRPAGETIALIEDAGLEVRHVEAMREHYARTIHAWQHNLERRCGEVTALIGGERTRVWRLYLAGGALAFEDGRMGVHQILARRR